MLFFYTLFSLVFSIVRKSEKEKKEKIMLIDTVFSK